MHVALSVLPAACAVGRTRSVKMNIMALLFFQIFEEVYSREL